MLRFTTLFAAALVCAAMPASAGEEADKYKAACKSEYAQGTVTGDACAVKLMVAETYRLSKLTFETRVQAEKVRFRKDCAKFLLDGVAAKLFTKERVVAAYGGTVTNATFVAQSCDVVDALGY